MKLQQSQLDSSREGAKTAELKKNIVPWRNIKDHKEEIFLNANSSEILEGEGKEHEITEKHCKKR